MGGLWQQYRHVFTGILLISIPTLIFSFSSEATRDENLAVRAYGFSQYASTGIIAGAGSSISDLWSDEEVERLRAENAQMKEERARLIGILQENVRLRKMVGFKNGHPEFHVVPSMVIARDVTPYFNVVRLRISTEESIEAGDAVVSADGVVGSVEAVSGRYAEVRLLTDPRSRIDAVSQRNRTRGIVGGFSENDRLSARLGYVSSADDVRVGDVFVTSGMAQRFPKELIIGTVTEIETATKDDEQVRISIEPATDFGRLQEVFVVVEER